MTRCLKGHFEVTGSDSGLWSPYMMECASGYEQDESTGLLIPVPDRAVYSGALVNTQPGRRFLLPDLKQVDLCQDKAMAAEVLGDLAPKTYWLRDTHGAGGQGAQMLTNYLPGRNYSVEFVCYKGEKLANFQKQRLSYSLKEKTEGLQNRGSSAVSVCTDRRDVWETAERALTRLATHTGTPLHGFYGVDLKEDEDSCPKVTEINAGRLLTASYSYFHLTGYNLPLVGVRAYFEEDQPKLPEYPVGWGVLRQVGQEPRLFGPDITKDWV